jgi:hypothetical protein
VLRHRAKPAAQPGKGGLSQVWSAWRGRRALRSVNIGTPISFDTLDKWEAWVAIGTILLALATLILGVAAFVSARETRRQRRNLTRPELIDLPCDPEGPEEVVTFRTAL